MIAYSNRTTKPPDEVLPSNLWVLLLNGSVYFSLTIFPKKTTDNPCPAFQAPSSSSTCGLLSVTRWWCLILYWICAMDRGRRRKFLHRTSSYRSVWHRPSSAHRVRLSSSCSQVKVFFRPSTWTATNRVTRHLAHAIDNCGTPPCFFSRRCIHSRRSATYFAVFRCCVSSHRNVT